MVYIEFDAMVDFVKGFKLHTLIFQLISYSRHTGCIALSKKWQVCMDHEGRELLDNSLLANLVCKKGTSCCRSKRNALPKGGASEAGHKFNTLSFGSNAILGRTASGTLNSAPCVPLSSDPI